MIDKDNYTRAEIADVTGCNEKDYQAIRRKLERYGVIFTYDKAADNFTITDRGDLFRQLCVWDYHLAENMDYRKFALYIFLIFVMEDPTIDYNSMPLEQLAEEILAKYPSSGITRQTLTQYRQQLSDIGIGFVDTTHPQYVLVNGSGSAKTYESIDAKTYKEAWVYYSKLRRKYKADSDPAVSDIASFDAYLEMVAKYGGHPKKHYPMTGSAFTTAEFAQLTELAKDKVIREKLET